MLALITNGGTHSPEDWAVATVDIFMPLSEKLEGGRRLEALKLRAAMAEALVPHHSRVHGDVRSSLAARGDSHFDDVGPDAELDPGHVDATIERVVEVSKGTPWEAHFADPLVQAAVREVVERHFRSIVDVEQQHHADSHPGHAQAQAYKAFRHPVRSA